MSPNAGTQSAVIVFGGGVMQIPVVDIVKRLGAHPIIVDSRKESPAALAHPDARQILLNPHQSREVVAACQALNGDGVDINASVAAGSDCSVTKAMVDRALYLADPDELDPWGVWSCTNKLMMRETLDPAFSPWWRHCANGAQLMEWTRSAPIYPLIVKPVHLSASRGIGVLRTPEDAKRHLAEHGGHLDMGWLLEEFIEGQQYSFDVFYVNGAVRAYTHCKRWFAEDGLLELGHVTQKPCQQADNIARWLATWGEQFGQVFSGIIKADLIVPDGADFANALVLELSMRFSGGFDSMGTAMWTHNYSLIEMYLRWRLGLYSGPTVGADWKTDERFAACVAALPPTEGLQWRLPRYLLPGYYGSDKGIAVLKSLGPSGPPKTADRPAFAMAFGATEEEAWENAMERCQNELVFETKDVY